jgi:hypothetical protein
MGDGTQMKPYVSYITKEGFSGVRARTWHPAWFIPVFKIWLRYWLDAPKRYKAYQRALSDIFVILHNDNPSIDTLTKIIRNVECGHECGYEEPYGFVREAGCPIHD